MSFLFPRKSPSLPQDDSTLASRKRSRQLEKARETWTWTTDVATLAGVPLAAEVPHEAKPTAAWFLEVAGVGLEVARNTLAVKRQAHPASDHEMHAKLDAVHARLQDSSADHATLEEMHTAEGATGPALAASAVQLAAMVHDLHEEIRGMSLESDEVLESYDTLFQTIELPRLASTFRDDATFARMRVAGPNPCTVRQITALPDTLPLTAAQFEAGSRGDSLSDALAQGRVFVLDLAEVGRIEPGSFEGQPQYLTAPIALFVRPKVGTSLEPVAIQCGQDAAKHRIFTRPPEGATDSGWDMAKTIVEVAEGNYHELFVHLARTHLLMEACVVSMYRQLAEVHPVHILLAPHFEGTAFINNSAAGSLIAENGPIDRIFAGKISSTQAAAVADRLAIDFAASMLPADLAHRGLADPAVLPDYPYRDDGMLVWEALSAWIGAYIEVYYADDSAVLGDTEVAAWLAELRGTGAVRGVPEVRTRADLTAVLTMMVFTGSAQHAAVNFPQNALMSYAPAISGSFWAPGPDDVAPSEAAWDALLPPIQLAQEQLQTLWLLGSIYYRPLGDYRTNHIPYLHWFEDSRITADGGPLARFQARLEAIETTIHARNRERAEPYEYLLPSKIPQSINI